AACHDLEKKLSDKELAYSQLMHSGDKLVSMSEALSHMESREQEVSRHLHEAAEQELSTQVKLSGLNEEITREQQRLELLRRERESEEDEHRRTLEKLAQEIDEARDRLADRMKREESAQTLRLKERINEMEEKHETLRSNLSASLDEKTVIVFAGDLIKRIDLVDILIQRFSGSGANASLEQQLRTLRASLEDILAQHNIHEFTVTPGTEVDVDLRLRITIVESTAGSGRPKVVESYRPGFIYAGENGREVILRKVEVKTSSA
ncbi:MAG: nucleotide exchange factor GrpE, partial [Verrucomicrobiaceae bacterium]